VVGENEPYAVSDDTDYTILVHGEQRHIPHVELEIRQDLLIHESDLQSWAERLAAVLEGALDHLFTM
jgi:predicted N-formylglutamate amidohydrolase